MTDPSTDLIVALSAHRDKLRTLEAIAKTTTDQMKQILTIDLQAFDKRLNSWATAAPLHVIMAAHGSRNKQP